VYKEDWTSSVYLRRWTFVLRLKVGAGDGLEDRERMAGNAAAESGQGEGKGCQAADRRPASARN